MSNALWNVTGLSSSPGGLCLLILLSLESTNRTGRVMSSTIWFGGRRRKISLKLCRIIAYIERGYQMYLLPGLLQMGTFGFFRGVDFFSDLEGAQTSAGPCHS